MIASRRSVESAFVARPTGPAARGCDRRWNHRAPTNTKGRESDMRPYVRIVMGAFLVAGCATGSSSSRVAGEQSGREASAVPARCSAGDPDRWARFCVIGQALYGIGANLRPDTQVRSKWPPHGVTVRCRGYGLCRPSFRGGGHPGVEHRSGADRWLAFTGRGCSPRTFAAQAAAICAGARLWPSAAVGGIGCALRVLHLA